MGRIANISLHRYDSWGSIERLGLPIRAHCETCGTILKVDVKVVIALRGRSGSPIDVRTPCKVFDCTGLMVFQGTWGGTLNTPWRDLKSD